MGRLGTLYNGWHGMQYANFLFYNISKPALDSRMQLLPSDLNWEYYNLWPFIFSTLCLHQ